MMLQSCSLHNLKRSGHRAALFTSRASSTRASASVVQAGAVAGWRARDLRLPIAMTKRDRGEGPGGARRKKRTAAAGAVGVAEEGAAPGSGAGGAYDAGTKVERLRQLLEKHLLSAYIVPTDDPHLCEMPPAAFRRRAYISGFTGSAGTALVTTESATIPAENGDAGAEAGSSSPTGADGHALLWTDGRYFLQAETELSGTPWSLMRAGMPDVPEPITWLSENLKPGSRVGIDPMVFTVQTARQFCEQLSSVQCSLIPVERNLVDAVWEEDARPDFPKGEVRVHPLKYAGVSVEEKLEGVRQDLREEDCDALLVNTLDEVCWLLNVRGADIENSPVVVAYVLVTLESCVLFVDSSKLGEEVSAHLEAAGVSVREYGDLKEGLRALCEDGARIWVDPNQCTSGLYDAMCKSIRDAGEGAGDEGPGVLRLSGGEDGAVFLYNPETGSIGREGEDDGKDGKEIALQDASGNLVEKKSPISMAKAQKNKAEIEGLVEAHLRDGVALAQFLEWLEVAILGRGETPTEFEISEKLLEFRSHQDGFIEPSFPTIAGEGENGAIIHYRPEEESCNTLTQSSMLLLDSGGQFDCGTTDVTRTVHFGEPTEFQRRCYTRVLKGHIALSTLVFPEGIPGFMVDSFARSSLWRGGLDYRHGTGHGVGAGLNVHEGPCGISARYTNTTGIEKGMVLSNEPGYYEDGSFGIRIENLVWVSKADTEREFGEKEYLRFNDLTMVPIQKKLMVTEMLSREELEWIDTYHAKVWEAIGPRVPEGSTTKDWLREATSPL